MLAADSYEPPFVTSMDLPNLVDEVVDNDWVVVKKQRIIIWIPPPTAEPPLRSVDAKFSKPKKLVRRNSDSLKKRGRRLSNSKTSKPATIFSENQFHVEAQLGKPSAVPEHKNQTDHEELRYQKSSTNIVSPVATGAKNNSHDHQRPLMQTAPPLTHGVIKVNSFGHFKRQTALPSKKIGGTPRVPIGALNFVNRRLRASNLERKLQLLGGLRTWLLSQGLGQFIRIFEREKVGIYQLVNLTMGKLKDMGADAVGPRRKLIHAVECLSKPYYLDGCSN
ncbi:hypothetical protein Cni_G04379 [Canna indica]|uniref:SAM domain-containing protein n=1 Tax=Canna indica TaxID=4628 RepID=A0AAQ3JVA6_9LILI|nr:hypothetical protein Cni_G04379 [Canna indica]